MDQNHPGLMPCPVHEYVDVYDPSTIKKNPVGMRLVLVKFLDSCFLREPITLRGGDPVEGLYLHGSSDIGRGPY